MRKKLGNILIGIIFIVAGIVFCGNVLELWDFDMFFDGWWTLFIIIPAVVSIFSSGFNSGNTFTLALGALLLISQRTDLEMKTVWKLVVPFVFIWIGISLVLKSLGHKSKRNSIPENLSPGEIPSYVAFFSGQNENYTNKVFTGANITSVFGGIDLDLRQAIINNDVTINVTNVFGGSDIFLPSNVKCVLADTPIFGGTDNKHLDSACENVPTVYITSLSVFGGMDIK